LLLRLTAAAVAALARRLPRPRRPALRLAVTNLYRPGATTGSVIMSLGLGLTVLVAIALIEGNLRHQVVEQMPEEAPGFSFIDTPTQPAEEVDGRVEWHARVEGMERVAMLRGRSTRVNAVRPQDMTRDPDAAWLFRGARGVTWAAEPPPGTQILAGEW